MKGIELHIKQHPSCLPVLLMINGFKLVQTWNKILLHAKNHASCHLLRPKKGFSVPLDKWLRGILKEQVLSYADEGFLRKQQIFDVVYTQNFLEKYMKNKIRFPVPLLYLKL